MSILIEQIKEIVKDTDEIAILANCSAILNESFYDINWVGFYLIKNDELVLGPFQGKVACSHIPFEKGVCGKCVRTKESQLITNVHKFDGHIACDSVSNSELVVPLIYEDQIFGVIDVDSPTINYFTKKQQKEMEAVAKLIAQRLA